MEKIDYVGFMLTFGQFFVTVVALVLAFRVGNSRLVRHFEDRPHLKFSSTTYPVGWWTGRDTVPDTFSTIRRHAARPVAQPLWIDSQCSNCTFVNHTRRQRDGRHYAQDYRQLQTRQLHNRRRLLRADI